MRKFLSEIPPTRIESSGFDSAGILWLVENGFTNVSDDALSSSLGSEKVARGGERRDARATVQGERRRAQ